MRILRTRSLLNFTSYILDTGYNDTVFLADINATVPLRSLLKNVGFVWVDRWWTTNNVYTFYKLLESLHEGEVEHTVEYMGLNLTHYIKIERESNDGTMSLRDYQYDEVRRLTDGDFAICGFQQRMGKMMIGCKLSEACIIPTVIVCPTHIAYDWLKGMNEWNKGETVLLDKDYFKQDVYSNKFKFNHNYIVPYSQIGKVSAEFQEAEIQVIIDEPQNLTNTKSLRGAGVRWLCKISIDTKLLSGTLYNNSPAELVGMFDNFNVKHIIRDLNSFRTEALGQVLCDGTRFTNWKPFWSEASTDEEFSDKLRSFLKYIGYKRTLRSEVMDIPVKERRLVTISKVNQTAKDVRDIESGDTETSNYFELCRKMTVKKVKTSNFKEWLVEVIDKTIIFYTHNEVRDCVCDTLRKASISYVISKDAESRALFQDGDKQVILVQLAATEGITLSAATNEIFVELPFTVGGILQAEDRFFGFNSNHSGTIYYPLDYNDPERRKLEILQNKASYTKALENDNSEILSEVL